MSENGKTMDAIFCKVSRNNQNSAGLYIIKENDNLQMSQLKESNAKLQNDVTVLKYSLLFSIMVTILVAIMIVHVLRTDMENSLDQEACHIPHGI